MIKQLKITCIDCIEVLYQGRMPHNVCVCAYHENINLLLEGLGHTALPMNHNGLVELVVCDRLNKACMFGQCPTCKGKCSVEALAEHIEVEHLDHKITWIMWKHADKVEVSGKVKEALAFCLNPTATISKAHVCQTNSGRCFSLILQLT